MSDIHPWRGEVAGILIKYDGSVSLNYPGLCFESKFIADEKKTILWLVDSE